MNFKKLKITKWQQFQDIEIDFHDRLTILTGANGSGKTTLLKLLAKHQGWQEQLFSVPKQDKITKAIKFFSRLWKKEGKTSETIIGSIEYSNNISGNINVPNSNIAQYQTSIQNQQQIECFYIPSHRSLYKYEPILNIPTKKKTKDMAFSEISNTIKKRYEKVKEGNENYILNPENNSFLMKSILIGWAIQGYGNNVIVKDQELIDNYEGFKMVLKKILPKTLEFENFEIRNMEVVFICNDGNDEFLLEAASGGISAIIDMAWQIYMFSTKEKTDFTVIIDEVENHLHPTMQRQILPDLLNAFPNTNFIVSTHSPLIVNSVRESNIFVLKYNEDNKIISEKLDLLNQAKTATEILDEVLGVSFTIPIWAEEKLKNIVDSYAQKTMTDIEFSNMRIQLKEVGLENLVPEAIHNLIEKANDKDK